MSGRAAPGVVRANGRGRSSRWAPTSDNNGILNTSLVGNGNADSTSPPNRWHRFVVLVVIITATASRGGAKLVGRGWAAIDERRGGCGPGVTALRSSAYRAAWSRGVAFHPAGVSTRRLE